jgi:alpha-tubulin suppressor-like RCC1 family protein
MSYRYPNAIIKPGLNTLVSPAPQYTYYLNSWGVNNLGQLGLGNTTNYSSPKQVGSLTNWDYVDARMQSSMAIKTDGTLWGWGNNASGQLGFGNTTNYSSPKQVGSLTGWAKISVGITTHTLAVKTDGTLWAWGGNLFGALGLNNTTDYSSPKQVGSLTNWSKVTAGYFLSFAIKTDGTLWAWGYNQGAGQLGLGNTTDYSSPKQVGSLTNWLYIACGYYNVIARKTDGTLWSWGAGNSGGLGLGNTTNYSSPKQIGALTTWANLGAGVQYFSFATKTDGTFWSWGRNNFGQLGLGNVTYYSSPKQIGSLTNWLSISGGQSFASATKTDGTLWAWGRNQSGQLGQSNTTDRSSPIQVGALTNWDAVSCGASHIISLTY